MLRIFRAAGIAAAAVAFFATASSPSFAVDLVGPPDAGIMAHGEVQLDESDLALDESTPAAPQPSDPAMPYSLGAVAPAAAIVQHAMAWLGGSDPAAEGDDVGPVAPLGLGALVESFANRKVTDAEEICLAKAVYFEARSEPIQGQLAVAQVVLNRAASGRYPATLCRVITQRAQFSFIRGGKFPKPDVGSEAWRKAVAIAHIARQGLARELAPNVLWYHASYVSPRWGRRLNRQAQIGLHIFYS